MADANARYNILDGLPGAIDPSMFRTQLRQPNALYDGGPVWENNHASPMQAQQRPSDWAVRSGIAEAISPTMGAYGMGNALGTTSNALMQQDWAGAAEAGLPLAMAMVPGLKGKPAAAVAEQPKGIRAYHGSPHDFDKFDASKIGTGEGAQAYGHGLYFAEQEATAKTYRDALSVDEHGMHVGGKPFAESRPSSKGWEQDAHDALSQAHGDFDLASQLFADLNNSDAGRIMAAAKFMEWERQGITKPNPGRMYEVNIKADPEHFLDWDKPLSQQGGKVRQFAEQNLAGYGDGKRGPLGMTGAEFVRGLGEKQADATPILKEQGIPGIKYLDQGSRGAGEGSRNYVVFDPATIEIMRKYGLLGPMAGGVAAGALQQSPNALYGDQ